MKVRSISALAVAGAMSCGTALADAPSGAYARRSRAAACFIPEPAK